MRIIFSSRRVVRSKRCCFCYSGQRSRLSEAEEWYGKAHRTAPDDPAVRARYADFLSSVGRLDDAAEQYEAAAALASDDHEIAVKTATTLRKAGRTSDSEAYYRRAVRLYPQVSGTRERGRKPVAGARGWGKVFGVRETPSKIILFDQLFQYCRINSSERILMLLIFYFFNPSPPKKKNSTSAPRENRRVTRDEKIHTVEHA